VVIVFIYLLLGMIFDGLSMMVMTLPVVFPLMTGLGFDAIWLGVVITMMVEIGMLTPPVGMNLFVLSTLIPEVPTRTVFRGVMPFVVVDVIRLAILVAFPIISLYLPSLMK
ncbi:MAG: TRAP transporter large permease subunit, partial [Betaproteobacteria bacterium]